MKFWGWLKGKTDPITSSPPSASTPVAASAEESYSTDQPIRTAADDRFARAPFAFRIAETIAARREISSLVLGLYGPWGDGKTSVLYMIEERLKPESDIIVVRFNPWHFTSEEQLIRGFFATLAEALGKSLATRGEKVGDAMKKYGGLLSIASASIGGGMLSLNPGQAAQGLGEALSTTTLDDLKVRIETGLSESGKRVVVLIDDIDRLDRAETHAIFKLVKLSAGFNYTTYLLAFDDDVVAAALGERYGEGGHAAGRAFLEKIIQVPLHLPPGDAVALRQLTYEGVDKAINHAQITLDAGAGDVFSIQFTSGLELKLETPRQARLYSNALMFSLPLVKGEVNIVDFMLVEGLRVFYPRLHTAIRIAPSLWIEQDRGQRHERTEQIRQVVEDATPDLTSPERDLLIRGPLKYLFPRISNISYGSDWETSWGKEKRVCSQAYFRRYFAYGVPPDDVSDQAIAELIAQSPALDFNTRQVQLMELLQAVPAPVIKKLRQREESVSEPEARALLEVIAPNGGHFPAERGMFTLGGTRTQAAVLVTRLLRNIPGGDDRAAVASEVIRTAIPLPFALECLRWMKPGRDEPESQHLLPPTPLGDLEAALASRIRQADDVAPLYRQFGADARMLYWIWKKSDCDKLSARLRHHLGSGGDEVDAFLAIHVGEAWGMEDGLPRPSDFSREAYDDISGIADPTEIMRLLRARYGEELDNPVFHHEAQVEPQRRIAHQFAVVHQSVGRQDDAGSSDRGGTEH